MKPSTPLRPRIDAPRRVLVVGESLIDIVATGNAPPVEIVGGSPANVALGLGRLGAAPRLVTALGNDERGHRIADHLEESGVAIAGESWSLARTATATARIRADGGADYEFEIEWMLPPSIPLRGAGVVHVGSIAAFLPPGADAVLNLVHRVARRVIVTFDPNIRPALAGPRASALDRVMRLAAHADVVKLSDEDAEWLWPAASTDDVADLLLHNGANLVAITLGRRGAFAATRGARTRVDAPQVPVVDTVGAGDTFMAALIRQVVGQPRLALDPSEAELTEVVDFSTVAASLTVQRAGADLPTEAQVRNALGRS